MCFNTNSVEGIEACLQKWKSEIREGDQEIHIDLIQERLQIPKLFCRYVAHMLGKYNSKTKRVRDVEFVEKNEESNSEEVNREERNSEEVNREERNVQEFNKANTSKSWTSWIW